MTIYWNKMLTWGGGQYRQFVKGVHRARCGSTGFRIYRYGLCKQTRLRLASLHPRRTSRRHRYYRHAHRPAPARRASRPRSRKTDELLK